VLPSHLTASVFAGSGNRGRGPGGGAASGTSAGIMGDEVDEGPGCGGNGSPAAPGEHEREPVGRVQASHRDGGSF
jgi:hypothetical protein